MNNQYFSGSLPQKKDLFTPCLVKKDNNPSYHLPTNRTRRTKTICNTVFIIGYNKELNSVGDIKIPITPSLAPFEVQKIARGAYGLGRMIHHDATPVAISGYFFELQIPRVLQPQWMVVSNHHFPIQLTKNGLKNGVR